MGVSKVIYDGHVIIDLTKDTITEGDLLVGYTAHDKYGTLIYGNMEVYDNSQLETPVIPQRIVSVSDETFIFGEVDMEDGGPYIVGFGTVPIAGSSSSGPKE